MSQAALALGATQSAVSRPLSKYEKTIGLQLLLHDVLPLKLTLEGLLLVTHAAEIDRSSQGLNEWLKTLKQGKEDMVRTGSFGPFASTRIIADFAKRYPVVSISILEGSDEMTRKDLVNGNVNVAVLGHPVDEIDAMPIVGDHLVALVQDGSFFLPNPPLH